MPLFQNESSFELFHLPMGLISMEMNLLGYFSIRMVLHEEPF